MTWIAVYSRFFFFPGPFQLEENWRELLEGSENLPERLQQQQDAIWELLQTELAYIRTLTVVKDVSGVV